MISHLYKTPLIYIAPMDTKVWAFTSQYVRTYFLIFPGGEISSALLLRHKGIASLERGVVS